MQKCVFQNLSLTGTSIAKFIFTMLAVTIGVESAKAQPSTPKFKPFQPISLPNSSQPQQRYTPLNNGNNHILPNNPTGEQNRQYLQKQGMLPGPTDASRQQQIDEANRDANQDAYQETMQRFTSYLTQFGQLNPENFSITKAVYLSEAVFFKNAPPFAVFESNIKQVAGYVRQLMQQRGLPLNNNAATNLTIQKLFAQDNIVHDGKTGKYYNIHFTYDFDDPFGDNDWTKMFVCKLLHTGTGQCHCMPLLYLCIAEQCHTKAYLSLAPEHSFIQFFDGNDRLANFETTCGRLVATEWLMQSDAITVTALKNGT